jgi:CRP-like cAMP-binding protein
MGKPQRLCVPSFFTMRAGRRKHLLTDKMRTLAAAALAQKIGYLRIDDFPDKSFDNLPSQSYSPNRIIRCKEEIFIVKEGLVEIWHTRYDKLVKELTAGVIFGDMPLLGQTLLGTKAITGKSGATVSVMNIQSAKRWIETNPALVVSELGNRLSDIETEHYRSQFQLADSRVAALLLELVGHDSTIEGVSHEQLGEKLGLYRETVTVLLDAMKIDKLIEVGRMRITILDKRAIREMSEL